MKKTLLFTYFIFTSFLAICQVSQSEKDALLDLYNLTNGSNWIDNTNWNTASPVSTWFGITVTNIDGQDHVTEINLNNNDLYGPLTSMIDDLIKLEILSLSQNLDLSGNIPDEIGNLSNLKELILFGCPSITGVLPTSIGNLSLLEILSIEDTQITGSIPESYSNLTMLEQFWLSYNQLSGNVPDIFSSMPLLRRIALNSNQFTGEVKLCSNSALDFVWLQNNLIDNVDLRNGNNTNISVNAYFNVEFNPNLNVVYVDDITYSSNNWTNIDSNTSFDQSSAICGNTLDLNELSFSKKPILYPNPTNGFIYLKNLNLNNTSVVTVTNTLGQSINLRNDNNYIDISSLSNGVYFINIIDKDFEIINYKIVKK